MSKKSVLYYDPKGANPESEGVSHIVVEGPLKYVTTTIYLSRRLEVKPGERQRLLSITEARRKYYFVRIPIPEIDPRIIENLELRLGEQTVREPKIIPRRARVA